MKLLVRWFSIFLSSLLLLACGGSRQTIDATPQATASPLPVATSTPPLAPTATTVPTSTTAPTDTTAPTPTLVPSPTPATTNTPVPIETSGVVPTALAGERTNTTSGYAFRPPSGWSVLGIGDLTILQPADVEPQAGPYILLNGGSPNQLGLIADQAAITTLDGLLDEVLKVVASRIGTEPEVRERTDVTLGGLTGRSALLRGTNNGVEVEGRIVVVRITEDRIFAALGFGSAARWRAASGDFDAMLTSVRFFEPVTIPIPSPSASGS